MAQLGESGPGPAIDENAAEPTTSAGGRRASTRACVSWVGTGYLLICVWVTVNAVFTSFGWPFPHSQWLAGEPAGGRGLALLAACGVAVSLAAVGSHAVSPRQWPLIAALAAWLLGPWLSMVVLGSSYDARYWKIAVSGCAVAFAATVVTANHLAALLRFLGWVFGWGSVIAGVSQLFVGWPVVLIGGDQRHLEWLSTLGISASSTMVLNGLSPGRLFLAMTCGLLLVIVLRQGRFGTHRWTTTLLAAGLVLAVLWSAGRVGVMAAGTGLIAAMIPWHRWPRWVAFLSAIVIPLAPLVASRAFISPEGSAQWRFDLWSSYFSQTDVWSPFGLGPAEPVVAVRGHAHNQLLESLSGGGWISLGGLLAFLYLALVVARLAEDNHLTEGIVFAMCGIFAFDVLSFAPSFTSLNTAFVMGVGVVVNAASPRHSRLLGKPADPLDHHPQHRPCRTTRQLS